MITVDFKKIDIRPGYRILDIGCGSGRHTCEAYRFENVTVIGADLNFHDVTEARNRLCYHDALGEHGGGKWIVSVADIKRLPFQDNSFDLVICSEVLEHIPEDRVAMREIIRILKPGKTLVVSVPRYFPEKICWALSDEYYNANQGHVRIYTKKQLIGRLEKEGVRNWGMHFAHSLHSPYWWLKCFVGPTREDSGIVNLYKRFLTWDIMKKPFITRFMDRLLNPLVGKSLVLYFTKQPERG
ncbi:MAG: class I SAM-dependent methyltransferase [Pseudomonadota bacterium]